MESCDEDLFCGVNGPDSKDPEKMDALEKKHTPVIEAPDKVKKGEAFEVVVRAGAYRDHPNEHEHFINSIELYSGKTFIGRSTFASARANPSTTFEIRLDHEHPLVAFVHCNLHGTWKSFPKKIEVEK